METVENLKQNFLYQKWNFSDPTGTQLCLSIIFSIIHINIYSYLYNTNNKPLGVFIAAICSIAFGLIIKYAIRRYKGYILFQNTKKTHKEILINHYNYIFLFFLFYSFFIFDPMFTFTVLGLISFHGISAVIFISITCCSWLVISDIILRESSLERKVLDTIVRISLLFNPLSKL